MPMIAARPFVMNTAQTSQVGMVERAITPKTTIITG